MTTFPAEAYHMKDPDEVRGDLLRLEKTEGGCMALIGKICVFLPSEMAEKLQGLIGRRIGILRLDGYRVKTLE